MNTTIQSNSLQSNWKLAKAAIKVLLRGNAGMSREWLLFLQGKSKSRAPCIGRGFSGWFVKDAVTLTVRAYLPCGLEPHQLHPKLQCTLGVPDLARDEILPTHGIFLPCHLLHIHLWRSTLFRNVPLVQELLYANRAPMSTRFQKNFRSFRNVHNSHQFRVQSSSDLEVRGSPHPSILRVIARDFQNINHQTRITAINA